MGSPGGCRPLAAPFCDHRALETTLGTSEPVSPAAMIQAGWAFGLRSRSNPHQRAAWWIPLLALRTDGFGEGVDECAIDGLGPRERSRSNFWIAGRVNSPDAFHPEL